MTDTSRHTPLVALAGGGTGGHLFPGLAVAQRLHERGCTVLLLTSEKAIDQRAVDIPGPVEVVALPAIGLQRGRELAFVRAFIRSYRKAHMLFKSRRPQMALAMGGFASAPPVLAAMRYGATTFLHESNTIPGRANRWLSWLVYHAFVGFPSAASGLHARRITVTGTPVRRQFQPQDPAVARRALDLDPDRPVLLVMGGSQGATALNEQVIQALPALAIKAPDWQWLHLSGQADLARVKSAYAALQLRAAVHPFLGPMELALAAATVAISRAGAASLAELAAMRLPAVLVPYPTASDNHQYHNARAFAETGAATLLEQSTATPEALTRLVLGIINSATLWETMRTSLAQWHTPRAAEQIADTMLQSKVNQDNPGHEHVPTRRMKPSRAARTVL